MSSVKEPMTEFESTTAADLGHDDVSMETVREQRFSTSEFPQTNFEQDQFQYRPMPALVAVSLGFTCLSLLSLMSELLLVVPLVGVLIAFIAYYQISRSHGDLAGGPIALTTLGIMLAMFVGFGAMHLHSYTSEVPEGASRVSFVSDIAAKGFQVVGQQRTVHPDVAKLAGQTIYLKGYMYPFRETKGLKSFVLCKDSGECCFGGQPQPTDMILVNMVGDGTADYHDKRLVGVAGTFRVEPTYDASGLQPVYQLDCNFFAPAKTWY